MNDAGNPLKYDTLGSTENIPDLLISYRSPLKVRLGDVVRFNCSSNISEFERIIRLVSIIIADTWPINA